MFEWLDEIYFDCILFKCIDYFSFFVVFVILEWIYDYSEKMFELLIDIMWMSILYVVFDIFYIWNVWVKNILMNVDEIVLVVEFDLVNLCNVKNMIDLLW